MRSAVQVQARRGLLPMMCYVLRNVLNAHFVLRVPSIPLFALSRVLCYSYQLFEGPGQSWRCRAGSGPVGRRAGGREPCGEDCASSGAGQSGAGSGCAPQAALPQELGASLGRKACTVRGVECGCECRGQTPHSFAPWRWHGELARRGPGALDPPGARVGGGGWVGGCGTGRGWGQGLRVGAMYVCRRRRV